MNFKIKAKENRKKRIISFDELVYDIINDLNVSNEFLVMNIKDNWEKIAGGILCSHSMPDRIFKHTLFIAVDHSVYANELMMMKNTILKKIDDTIGPNIIKTVKIETKRLNEKRNVHTSWRK